MRLEIPPSPWEQRRVWNAVDAGVPQTSGSPPDPNQIFFQPPPEEIGQLLSASSMLGPHSPTSMTWVQRLSSAAGGNVGLPLLMISGLLGVLIGVSWRYGKLPIPWWAAAVPLFVVVVVVMVVLTRRAGHAYPCLFVGREGLARSILQRGTVRQEVLRFADAAELKAVETRNLVSGRHTDTELVLTWLGPKGKTLFRMGAILEHVNPDLLLEHRIPRDTCKAAREAWTQWIASRPG